ncbi:hypothetical protein HAX54_025349 [Datura stramonium]|uniref:Uncharacterized protein n=1 Tax=Datura stramonium TaxID=4076 RepID=A0ABS8S709_DATST|nr:hypothetical protein [Datura stramonium]
MESSMQDHSPMWAPMNLGRLGSRNTVVMERSIIASSHPQIPINNRYAEPLFLAYGVPGLGYTPSPILQPSMDRDSIQYQTMILRLPDEISFTSRSTGIAKYLGPWSYQ